jgi:hypothetical protein
MRRPATLRMVSVESGGRVYPDRGNKASNSTTSRTGRAGEHAIQGGGEEILTSWGLPLAEDEAHGGGRGWIRLLRFGLDRKFAGSIRLSRVWIVGEETGRWC